MKKLFIVANWKSNKTSVDTDSWFGEISQNDLSDQVSSGKEIIVCPPYTLLQMAKSLVEKFSLPLKIGAENISPFEEGAFTGEINANQIREFAEYVIIGHSERRKNFAETDEMLSQKVQKAIECSLMPIFCVQGADTPIPESVELAAYEPIFAIGTGNPDTPENAEAVIKTIKEKNPSVKYVLYGGSVTPEGVGGFTQKPFIDGVLVGGASLLADKFIQIIKNS
jgi:triosephosphate isomerase (TIM)